MRNLRFQLPPLNSLVTFEAAARHLSFTKAGEELLISREAVSRQIKILEEFLAVKLFLRLYRSLQLTDQGEELCQSVQEHLQALAQTSNSIRGANTSAKVSIAATVAIASYWLTPRLPEFRRRYPELELRVSVSDEPHELSKQNLDVGLRYGRGKWPGVRAIHLFDIQSFPVCTPEYLKTNPPIGTSEDLLAHTLLNLDGMPHATEDWAWWLEQAGIAQPMALRLLGFDNYSNVIQAALDSQGIAIGFSGIVDGILKQGALVQPLDIAFSKGRAVYLTLPNTVKPRREVQNFIRWVTEVVARD